MRRLRNFLAELRLWLSLVAIVMAILGVLWVFPSYLEARAFNRATGQHVSTWDAMFVRLRVQGDAK